MRSSGRLSLLILAASVLLFGGCASNQLAQQGKPEVSSVISSSMQEADRLMDGGHQKDAVKLLNDLAGRYPDRKEPWAKLAKVYFDASEYARAIIAAEEAVQRDPADRSMKTIRAVSGLRVASQSLNDLKGDLELKGDAKADAVSLVKVMREILGEEVLVPPDDKKKRPAAASVPAKTKARPLAAPAAVPAGNGGKSGNPFGTLR